MFIGLMKKENGITMISLVITVVIMSILAAILIKATLDGNILEQKDKIENDFYGTMEYTENRIKSEREKWEGVI